MLQEHFDVLIVGGGLAGIGAAAMLQKRCPQKSYMIVEARAGIGGTWDVFRYPGVRSDSDMFTLGYSFRPWEGTDGVADGASILEYIRQTASECGIDRKVRYNHRVRRATWNCAAARWNVEVECEPTAQRVHYTCHFLLLCSGYYSYEQGHTPAFAGSDRFNGIIVHPQAWPLDLCYRDKRVVVIGSGSTAVTLIPAMAKTAAHVTMLQRSPTYVVSAPAGNRLVNFLRRHLPKQLAYALIRWRSVLLGLIFFQLCRCFPRQLRNHMLNGVRNALGSQFDVATHFTPRYKPWDQRICWVPDGDLFDAIKSGKASVSTGQIDCFTAHGLRLQNGEEIPADIVVTATGLNLVMLGSIELIVDDRSIDPAKLISYKGTMYEGVPNLASVFGYSTASWMLKCELSLEYLCRLLGFMDRTGRSICVPCNEDPTVVPEPWLKLTSGYVRRSVDLLPKQGSKKPWKLHHNYVLDLFTLRFGAIDDGTLRWHLRTSLRQQAPRTMAATSCVDSQPPESQSLPAAPLRQ